MNEAQREYWSGDVGRVWAEEQSALDDWLGAVDAPLLAAAQPMLGDSVLDVGCGAGATTLALASRVGPSGTVTGVDLSPQLLARARERLSAYSHVRFLEADAQVDDIGDGYDLIASRFGVMFFADPVEAFARLRKACAPGGRLAFACWRAVAVNPAFSVPVAAVAPLLAEAPVSSGYAASGPDPDAPGPLAFADHDRTAGILAAAGWRDIAVTPAEVVTTVASGPHALTDAVRLLMRIGPAAAAVRELGKDARPAVQARLSEALIPWHSDGTVRLPAGIWILTALA